MPKDKTLGPLCSDFEEVVPQMFRFYTHLRFPAIVAASNHRRRSSQSLTRNLMAPSSNRHLVMILTFFSVISAISADVESRNGGGRVLMGFKETPEGGNVTYDCSPSGPCVPCAYSEKNDEKYRCSETGYRIPLKCLDSGSVSKKTNDKKEKKGRSTQELAYSSTQRHLLEESSESDSSEYDGKQGYITYRSCIPAENEEKLSVLGFEALMLGLLLVSGSAMIYRRKRVNNVGPGGAVRVPNNSRF